MQKRSTFNIEHLDDCEQTIYINSPNWAPSLSFYHKHFDEGLKKRYVTKKVEVELGRGDRCSYTGTCYHVKGYKKPSLLEKGKDISLLHLHGLEWFKLIVQNLLRNFVLE